MRITGIHNIEIADRAPADVRRIYEEILGLTAQPDSCPNGKFSVGVGGHPSPIAGLLTFSGSGTAIRAITFAVARGTLPKWRARLSQARIRPIGRAWQFTEEYLCFVDDSNFDLALAEVSDAGTRDSADRVLGFRGLEISDRPDGELQALLQTVGLNATKDEGPILRYELLERSNSVAIDVFRSSALPRQPQAGQGSPQRINFQVRSAADLEDLAQQVRAAGFELHPFCCWSSAFVVKFRARDDLQIGFIGMQHSPLPPVDARNGGSNRPK